MKYLTSSQYEILSFLLLINDVPACVFKKGVISSLEKRGFIIILDNKVTISKEGEIYLNDEIRNGKNELANQHL